MKTRLPKTLLSAMLVALSMPAMSANLTTANITKPNGADSYLNVGTGTETHNWAGNLTVGNVVDANGNVTQPGVVDKVGSFNSEGNFIIPDGTNTITNSLTVSGDVTVNGKGQIILGGQYKVYGKHWLTGKEEVKEDHYQGLSAKKLTVDGTGSAIHVDVTHAQLTDLHIKNGQVELANTANCTGGNSFSGGSDKQTTIKNSIVLEGGSLIMGYNNAQKIGQDKHYMTAFGRGGSGFKIEQTGGFMKVQADSIMKSGFTIDQIVAKNAVSDSNSGNMDMIFRDVLRIDGSGTNTINQSNDNARLVIGKLYSTDRNDIIINQDGAGLIHLAYGAELAYSRKNNGSFFNPDYEYTYSSIQLNQSGGGTINLGGGHDTQITSGLPGNFGISGFSSDNTTYTITQTDEGGLIKLNTGASITADTVTQNSAGAVINIASGATLTADEITMSNGEIVNYGAMEVESLTLSGGTLDVGAGATLTVKGTLTFCLSAAPQAQTLAAVTGDSSTSLLNLAEGSSLTFNPETLVITFTQEILDTVYKLPKLDGDNDTNTTYSFDIDLNALLSGAGEGATELETALLEELTTHQLVSGWGGNYVSIVKTEATATEGVYTVTLQHVPEPATATLSLLALAGLCARRRRH